MDREDFSAQVAAAARAMRQERVSQDAMDRAVSLAPNIIRECDLAAVTLVRPKGLDSLAASNDLLRDIVERQHELAEGPCLTAADERQPVVSDDLSTDPRWPGWGALVSSELKIHSVLSCPLFVDGDNLGMLNLYAREKGAFASEAARDAGLAFAAHVAVALAGTRESEQLHAAVESRTLIGQATGILMERFDLTPDLAFGVLARLSQDMNRKIRDLAEDLVTTRVLLGPEG